MGQDSSTPIDESVPPQTLEDRTIEAVAKYVKEGRAKNIVVMCGAGISTSAGIPDFRSPNTGLYANLAKLNLPYAEAVFDISYFRTNPLPFYALAHELYPAKYKPTIAHLFLRLLSDKGLLLKVFTQNIDCLEREAGVPADKIIEAHGSFASQRCIECQLDYPTFMMREAIQNREVPRCLSPRCGGLVKPDIVFFGEQLPEAFHLNRALPGAADLCFVMGTSLSVQPFASLPGFCGEGVPRVLINLERVGSLGSRADDVLLLGDCDSGVRTLAAAMGWAEELDALWADIDKTNVTPIQKYPGPPSQSFKDEYLDYQIAELTREVEQALKLSEEHDAMVRKKLIENRPESPPDERPADIPDTSAAQSTERAAALKNMAEKRPDSRSGEDPATTSDTPPAQPGAQAVADYSTPEAEKARETSVKLHQKPSEIEIREGSKDSLQLPDERASPQREIPNNSPF